jgi:hypothetical protein
MALYPASVSHQAQTSVPYNNGAVSKETYQCRQQQVATSQEYVGLATLQCLDFHTLDNLPRKDFNDVASTELENSVRAARTGGD